MNMKRGLMILSLGAAVALGGFGSGQAFFNSPLAANSHYRPINFGMGYEMYVDLSSLETVKDDGQGWLYNDSTHSWQEIPMRKKEIKHNQIADFVAVNLCYKQKTGQYLNDDYGYAKGMERYYKGE